MSGSTEGVEFMFDVLLGTIHTRTFLFLHLNNKQISIHFSLKVRNIKKKKPLLKEHMEECLSLVNMSVSVSCDFCLLIPVKPEHFSCTVQQAVHSPESHVKNVVLMGP